VSKIELLELYVIFLSVFLGCHPCLPLAEGCRVVYPIGYYKQNVKPVLTSADAYLLL
jgi:hypothetical protein